MADYRRLFPRRSVLIGLAVALPLTACATAATTPAPGATAVAKAGTAPPASATPAPAPTAAKPGQADSAGTLVIVASTDPGNLNPAISTSGALHFVAGSLYNGLVALDRDFKPEPELAESWTVSDDGKTYAFRLRKNVKWHDGKPFTSADVKFTFEELLLKFHARTKTGVEPVLAGIDTPDENTVVMRFKAPYAPLLQQLNVIEAPILPKHLYEGSDPQQNPANLKPVGTGPFRFVEYRKGQQAVFERNPDYFKPGLPKMDKVIFQIIPEPATAMLAFERGEVDYVSVPGADLARVEKMAGITVGKSAAGAGGSFCVQTIIPNLERKPLDKLEVRQALNLAIDRERMVTQTLFGQGRSARGPIASTMWAFDSSLPAFQRDVSKANALLDSAGLSKQASGPRFSLTAVFPTTMARPAEILKDNLADVGVALELKMVDFNEANQTVFIKREFDLGYASYCNGPDPEVGVRRAYDSTNIKPVLFSNGAAYKNPRVDALFTQAVAEVDRQKRSALYAEVQKLIVADLPYFWLYESESSFAHRSDIKDLRPWTSSIAEYASRDRAK
jgi:peptide/nickel transport system substrate-binding protein